MNGGNQLGPLSDDHIVAEHSQHGVDNQYLTEMLRRHKQESSKLGDKIRSLNRWLLVFTVAIFALTGVLVWTALREVGEVRRQSTPATSPSRDEGVWVLWHNTETVTRVNADGRLAYTWSLRLWEPRAAHTARNDCMEALGLLFERWPEKPKVGDQRSAYSCLPDTIDPRGPKGK